MITSIVFILLAYALLMWLSHRFRYMLSINYYSFDNYLDLNSRCKKIVLIIEFVLKCIFYASIVLIPAFVLSKFIYEN